VLVVIDAEDGFYGPHRTDVDRAALAAAWDRAAWVCAADNPAIDEAVRATGRGTAVLVGLETDVCVAQSAIGWRAAGLRAVVVHDAVFSAGAAHGFGMRRLAQEGIEMVSAKELYYEWLRTLSAVRGFDSEHPGLATPPGFSL
jgi:nicotinamidase-related amidase